MFTVAAFLLLALDHVHVSLASRRSPTITSFARNAQTRNSRVQNIREHNHDILAVQTLRNRTFGRELSRLHRHPHRPGRLAPEPGLALG
ncbi:MAG: hypothetical protein AB1456_06230, partial [Thermodesulfobacteriota bacterium]